MKLPTKREKHNLGESVQCPQCKEWYLENDNHPCNAIQCESCLEWYQKNQTHHCGEPVDIRLVEKCKQCNAKITFKQALLWDYRCWKCFTKDIGQVKETSERQESHNTIFP